MPGLVNPFAPPDGTEQREVTERRREIAPRVGAGGSLRNLGRTLASVVLALVASLSLYSVLGRLAEAAMDPRGGRGSNDMTVYVVVLAVIGVANVGGALAGVAVQSRPWWPAPLAVAALGVFPMVMSL